MHRFTAPLRIAGSVLLFCGLAAVTVLAGTQIAERRSGTSAIECIGDERATADAVYLHGYDGFGPSWQELRNRRVLAKLAARYDLRIAMPRGPMCGSHRCWPYDSQPGLRKIRDVLEQAQSACFDGGRGYGVIGFSNGGFAAAELFEDCHPGDVDWVINSGSGGFIEDTRPQSLRSCGKFVIVIGSSDRYHRTIARDYYTSLVQHQADATLIEFEGGHWLDDVALGDALTSARRRGP